MKTNKAAVHPLPFADCILAAAVAPVDVDDCPLVFDPRRLDLPEDSEAWLGLLARTHVLDGDDPRGLFGALHGLRCFGARLQPTRTGMRLYHGEMTRDEYRELRAEYLTPYVGTLRRLLSPLPVIDESELLTR